MTTDTMRAPSSSADSTSHQTISQPIAATGRQSPGNPVARRPLGPETAAQGVLAAAATASNYRVIAGDTGNGIARKLGITFDQLSAANPGVNWNNLQIGQSLNVPGGGGGGGIQRYSIGGGDTGVAIAQRFGITFDQLSAANSGVNWNALSIGQILNIPSRRAGGGETNPIPGGDSGTDGGGPVRFYSGPASNFPDPANWQRWSLMWARNSGVMRINDSPQEVAYIDQAINTVARESGIERRVILAMIMQESQGNVRVNATYSADRVRNTGLMQSHNGVSFDPNNTQGSILQMVRDGVQGTPYGDGMVQLLARYGNMYAALRGYNSGSVDANNLSYGFSSTPSYVSDVANRLMGAPPN
jgi:LysM repeat protein